jgi:LacI family transcriptional regulator
MATIRDVATAAGVSTATVSAVVNRSAFVSAALEARVRRAIDATGYRPHALARALKTGSARVLGLVLPDLDAPGAAALAARVAAAARQHGLALLLELSADDPAGETACLERLGGQRVAGLMLMPAGGGADYADQLKHRLDRPAVLLDRAVEGLAADAAGIDHQAAAAAAAAHLLALGHRAIALIAGPPQASTTAAQLAGLRAALAARALAAGPRLVRIVPGRAGHAAAAARALIGGPDAPTAIIAGTAAIALEVLGVLRALDLAVPADLSLLSLEEAAWMAPLGIGAAAAPMAALAESAVALLLARMGDPAGPPQVRLLAARLEPRASTAAPGKKGFTAGTRPI